MSLINDALKKAQQDRAPADQPDAAAPHAARRPQATPSHQAPAMVKYVFAGMILMAVFGTAVAFFMFIAFGWADNQREARQTPAEPELQVVEARIPPPSTPAQPAPTRPTAAPGAGLSLPDINLNQIGSASSPSPTQTNEAPVVATPDPAPSTSPATPVQPEQPVVATPTPPSPPATAAPANRMTAAEKDRAIRDFLSRLNIQMVRVSGERSRIMMNGEVHGVGSEVNFDLGLRIKEIYPQQIIFETNDGAEYKRPF